MVLRILPRKTSADPTLRLQKLLVEVLAANVRPVREREGHVGPSVGGVSGHTSCEQAGKLKLPTPRVRPYIFKQTS